MSIEPNCVFRSSDPIVVGIKVIQGELKKGTPICVVTNKKTIDLGKVFQIKTPQGDSVESIPQGDVASIELRGSKRKVGIHFKETEMLYSKITRHTLDLLKKHCKATLTKTDVKAIIELKKKLKIQ